MRKFKLAVGAYKAALDDEPDNPDTERALAAALLADNQLAEALPVFQQLVAADPTDVESQLKVSEIQRRQGHYDDALVTLNKAKASNANQENPELSFNEAVLYDSLGKFDQAVAALKAVLASTQKPDGKYSEPERNNRGIFLSRLGVVYNEQNKIPEAVAAYKEMIALGADYVVPGYQGIVDTYRGAHQWKEAASAAGEAAKALPKTTTSNSSTPSSSPTPASPIRPSLLPRRS